MKRDFEYYIRAAQEAEDKSVGLWRAMNQVVRSVLETQKKKGKTLNYVADSLDEIAGDAKMTCVNNLRIAAKQIRARRELVLPKAEKILQGT